MCLAVASLAMINGGGRRRGSGVALKPDDVEPMLDVDRLRL